MRKPTPPNVDGVQSGTLIKKSVFRNLLQTIGVCSLAMAALTMLAPSASAQGALRFRPEPFRLTVPVNRQGTITFTNSITFSTNASNNITFDIPDLPTNATIIEMVIGNGTLSAYTNSSAPFVYATNNSNNVFPWFIVSGATNAAATPNSLTIKIGYTNVDEGIYTFHLTATNDSGLRGSIPMFLQSAYIWSGSTNARIQGIDSWDDGTKWTNGAAPANPGLDDVVFNDLGGQTNASFTFTNTTTTNVTYTTNVLIAGDHTIGSLRFAQYRGNGTANHTLSLTTGSSLNVIGTNGLSITPDILPGLQSPTASFTILQGQGSVIISNTAAIFDYTLGGTIPSSQPVIPTLMMTNLDNLKIDVARIFLGDTRAFPFYYDYSASNQVGNYPQNNAVRIHWAKTNIVRATYVDPFNYTNVWDRSYSLSMLFNNSSGNGGGNDTHFELGISNAFFMDSIMLVGPSAQTGNNGRYGFNNIFAGQNPVAMFRNADGVSRMSMFVVCDDGGNSNNAANSNCKGSFNFATGGGYMDMLVDRFYMARDRILIGSNQTPNVAATMYIGKGNIDANTVILGYQEHDGKSNWSAIYTDNQSYLNWCEGNLNVTNGATFKVNGNLVLGWTGDSNPNNGGNQYSTWGQFTLRNHSTAMVNYVNVDPGLGLSYDNTLTINNSTFILSNTIADPAGTPALPFTQPVTNSSIWLGNLNLQSAGILTVHLDANRSTPYIYVTNLTSSGSGSIINVATIAHSNVWTYPVTVPIIQYTHGGVAVGASAPAPFNVIVTETGDALIPGVLQLVISTNPPKHLVWRGGASANWNFADKNWADLDNSMLITNFASPDYVFFEDSAAYPTNITVTIPAMISKGGSITNGVVNHHFINGGGSFVGSATFTNNGTGTMQWDVNSSINFTHNGGTLIGAGAAEVGNVTAATGTIVNWSGAIDSGLTTAGAATLLAGTIDGGVSVQSGGAFTNFAEVRGGLAVQTNTVVNNTSAGLIHKFNSATIGVGSILINSGTMGFSSDALEGYNNQLTINGELDDLGVNPIVVTTLTIAGGNTNGAGLFKPGGTGYGTTTIQSSGVGTAVATFPGRLLMVKNSTNVFKVDMSQPGQKVNAVDSTYVDFGGSQAQPNFNGATLILTNFGPAFNPGDLLRVALRNGAFNFHQDGSSSNAYPRILPAVPGPNLRWDLSRLTGEDPLSSSFTNGLIEVKSVANTPTNLTQTYLVVTNWYSNAANTVLTTNRDIVSHLTWPTNYIGWGLEEQENATKYDAVNSPKPGISTNWNLLYRSVYTNDIWFTNTYNSNDSVFFRMIFPIPDFDLIGVSQ